MFDTKVSYYAYGLFIYLYIALYLLTVGIELLLHLITLSVLHARGRTLTGEGSARHGDPYFTTHITRTRQTSMPRRD
jgi:hypothetical protein